MSDKLNKFSDGSAKENYLFLTKHVHGLLRQNNLQCRQSRVS